MARRLASRLACVSTTPLGSPVLPEVYCRKATSAAPMAGAAGTLSGRATSGTVATACSVGTSARSRCASGLARSTVSSSRAFELRRMPAMRRRWSSSCDGRAGGYSGSGTPPARRMPKNAAKNSRPVGSMIATASPRSSPRACRPAATAWASACSAA